MMTTSLQDFLNHHQHQSDSNEDDDAESRLECFLSVLVQDDADDDVDDSRNNKNNWNESSSLEEQIIYEMATLLQRNGSATSSEKSLLMPEWSAALSWLATQILPHLTAFGLHAAVMMHASQWMLLELVKEKDETEPDDETWKRRPPLLLHTPLVLLLCAHALQQCPPQPTKRRARWRSLVFETIRLVQRLLQDEEKETSYPNNIRRIRLIQVVWQAHLVPSLVHVRDNVMMLHQGTAVSSGPAVADHPNNPHETMMVEDESSPAAVACLAALVRTSALLAQQTVGASSGNRNEEKDADDGSLMLMQVTVDLAPLIASLRHVAFSSNEFSSLEYVLGSFWLQKASAAADTTNNITRTSTTASSLLKRYTLTRSIAGDNDDDDNSDNGEDDDWLCFCQTVWDDIPAALSLLQAATWTNRPCVYSIQFQWQVYFGFIAPLLLGMDDDASFDEVDDDNENDARNQKPRQRQFVLQQQQQALGLELLQNLLACTPGESLPPPRPAFLQPSSSQRQQRHPLNPTGTMQLLSNQMMVMAESVPTVSGGTDAVAQQQQQQQAARRRQYAYESLQTLLSKYSVVPSQFQLVQELVQSCPHAGIVPKLMDLWRRPLRMAVQLQQNGENDTNGNSTTAASAAAAAESQMWNFLDEHYLQQLDEHVLEQRRKRHLDSPPDNDKNNGMVYAIQNVQDLILSVEVFCAILGLIQLRIMNGHATTSQQSSSTKVGIPNLVSRMVRVKGAVETLLEQWTTSTTTPPSSLPAQHFRLYLLQDGLVQTLELLEQQEEMATTTAAADEGVEG